MHRKILTLAILLALALPLIAACGANTTGESTNLPAQPGESEQTPTGEVAQSIDTETEETDTPTQIAGPTSASVQPTGTAVGEATAALGGTAGPTGTASGSVQPTETGTTGTRGYTLETPPAVANAAEARQHSGTTITFRGDNFGLGAETDKILARKFQEETGIRVNVVPIPQSVTDTYAMYQRFFQAQSPNVDAMILDVIWPGAFAEHLVDLTAEFGDEADDFYPGIVQNNTVEGKLVAVPWFSEMGMLYYRTDLLEKYGFSNPPETWDELEQQAKVIMEGERQNNKTFQGFVFQGNAYEGLTCDALEWVASNGGGTFIDPEGKVTINNPQAVEILNKARGWVGAIAPQGVTAHAEEDARNIFQAGNAAFMRNWSYAYALGQADDSKIKDKFAVAALPAAEGQKHVGTIGGAQVGVSKYSKNQDAAIEWVRYLSSQDVQMYRTLVAGTIPTRIAVAENPDVLEAKPYLALEIDRVARPSTVTGDRYNEASTAIFQGVHQILNGADAAQVLPTIEQRLNRLVD